MASFKLDPAKTALVVIDMTKGVVSLSSGPYPVQEVLAKTVCLAETFRRTGSFVVLVNVHSIDGKDLLHPITDTEIRLPTERPFSRVGLWLRGLEKRAEEVA
jgi:nicotinamidase-related amidase